MSHVRSRHQPLIGEKHKSPSYIEAYRPPTPPIKNNDDLPAMVFGESSVVPNEVGSEVSKKSCIII